MKIIIGVGLDNIIFGLSQDEVKDILGKPDKVSETEKTDNIVYSYNYNLTKYKFDKDEDYRLETIETYNPEVILFGEKIVGMSKEQIKDLLIQNNYYNTEYEEYDFFETLFCENIWTTFQFNFDRLQSLEFSPLFKDENERIWPCKN